MSIRITFVFDLAELIPGYYLLFAIALGICLYFSVIFMSLSNGGTLDITCLKSILITSSTAITLLAVDVIFVVLRKTYSFVGYILIFTFLLIYFFVFNIVIDRMPINNIQILDLIEYDENNFDSLKSADKYLMAVVDGFRYSHPICLSWKIFKLGIHK
jgi:hypothetical protein